MQRTARNMFDMRPVFGLHLIACFDDSYNCATDTLLFLVAKHLKRWVNATCSVKEFFYFIERPIEPLFLTETFISDASWLSHCPHIWNTALRQEVYNII